MLHYNNAIGNTAFHFQEIIVLISLVCMCHYAETLDLRNILTEELLRVVWLQAAPVVLLRFEFPSDGSFIVYSSI